MPRVLMAHEFDISRVDSFGAEQRIESDHFISYLTSSRVFFRFFILNSGPTGAGAASSPSTALIRSFTLSNNSCTLPCYCANAFVHRFISCISARFALLSRRLRCCFLRFVIIVNFKSLILQKDDFFQTSKPDRTIRRYRRVILSVRRPFEKP
jgi:hypothetical protein